MDAEEVQAVKGYRSGEAAESGELAGTGVYAPKQSICLLNDSFPPILDGVANTVVNYGRVLTERGYGACVVTPSYPDADDSGFPFPVERFPSIDVRNWVGYTAGNPFDMPTLQALKQRHFDLLHCHCPIMSMVMARTLRESLDVPLVLTYHTKYDIDIENSVPGALLQDGAISVLADQIAAADEVWAVSNGAGESLRAMGYEGDWVVMENGVDMPRGVASEADQAAAVRAAEEACAKTVPHGVPVLLFVGRLVWYKGCRLILDALAALVSRGIDFRMVFVGGGLDADEIAAYADAVGVGEKCLFVGAVHDRSVLAAWYSRADLLVFPSTFDTNGLVVREAAACSTATVLVGGSCAAEGVTDNVNGLLVQENAASLAVCLAQALARPEGLVRIGEAASRDLYLSWDQAVAKALDRYQVVMENHKRGLYPRKRQLSNGLFALSGGFLDLYDRLRELKGRDARPGI